MGSTWTRVPLLGPPGETTQIPLAASMEIQFPAGDHESALHSSELDVVNDVAPDPLKFAVYSVSPDQ